MMHSWRLQPHYRVAIFFPLIKRLANKDLDVQLSISTAESLSVDHCRKEHYSLRRSRRFLAWEYESRSLIAVSFRTNLVE